MQGITALHYPLYEASADALEGALQDLLSNDAAAHATLPTLLDLTSPTQLATAGRLLWQQAQKARLLAVGSPSSHNRRIYATSPSVTRALRFHARSPCSATPSMRFLFIGSRFTLHASFPRSVAITQLRFTSFTVTSSWRDLHPQVCAQ